MATNRGSTHSVTDPLPAAEPLLAAIAVLTGLLFALLVLMFEWVVHERGRKAPAAGNDPVVDAWQLLANVSWAGPRQGRQSST